MSDPHTETAYDPNADLDRNHDTWYRFTLPTGQECWRPAAEVIEADWHGATEVDRFSAASWEQYADGTWIQYGTKDNGQRLPINVIEGCWSEGHDRCQG